MAFSKQNINVAVSQIKHPIREAATIYLVVLNGPKLLKLSSEVVNRIHKSYLQKILIPGNRISIMYYGKSLIFEVKLIEPPEDNSLEDNFKELNIDESYMTYFRVEEKTKWKLFR